MGVPRKIVQIAAATSGDPKDIVYPHVFALADDGTVWWQDPPYRGEWSPVAALPDAEGCRTKHPLDEESPCRFAAGHRDQHWNGHRRWG
jgi:hypothetical protein